VIEMSRISPKVPFPFKPGIRAFSCRIIPMIAKGEDLLAEDPFF